MVTDAQVRRLRQKMEQGKTQEAAAAAAGMSVRSARKWSEGEMPSASNKPRTWRTREDPLAKVWESEVVVLLQQDEQEQLQATTILQMLDEKYPGEYGPAVLRTLQRRVSDWRTLYGAGKEVYFEQEHVPGREGAVDFTHCTELGVTIAGELFVHLLFQFVLSFSKWRWVCLAYSETFEALVFGLQGALWDLGGVPGNLRSDNLSAATHELKEGGRGLNKRFRGVLDHYGMKSSRIRPGKANENGVVEKSHDTTKTLIKQALQLRGSQDFESAQQYILFVREVMHRRCNCHIADRLLEEKLHLQQLPPSRVPDYTIHEPVVRKWSTIRFSERTYSVPSRLIGRKVKVHQHPNTIEVYYKGALTDAFPRLRGKQQHRIDYRHVIWSLVRKPGAFARYRYREELFPTIVFRKTYDAIVAWKGERADIEYLRILHLAASTLESRVESALYALLERGDPFDYVTVKDLAAPDKPIVPVVRIGKPDIRIYNGLLGGGAE